VIKEAYLVGATEIICPSYPKELFSSGAACQQFGEELNNLGASFRAYGLQLHFHNHAAELAVVDGRRVFDWILAASEPRHLLCQADVYWVKVGGSDPAQFIREQGARIQLLHLKDQTEIGGGPVDFLSVFAAVESVGVLKWYVVEVEKYNFAPLESVRRSFEQLKAWGKT
jgi:sugar phosphate isomerase/epimerase